MIALLFSVACAKAPLPLLVDWGATPRLPAPTAATYEATPGKPEDKAVASVVSGRKWDSSLAGAAAGIALKKAADRGNLSAPELREAAHEAGWPYPITSARMWAGEAGKPPPDSVHKWLATVPDNASIGLVRARDGSRDLWVALASEVRTAIGPMPRQLPVGARLRVPEIPGAEVWVADPVGRLDRGNLDIAYTRTTDLAGEWLVEVRDAKGAIANFPVYVGIVPPNLSLLVPTPLPSDWQETDALVVQRLGEIREAYGYAPLESDLLLESAATSVAEDPSIDVSSLAPRIGVEKGDVWRLECQAPTVEACLDEVLWDVRARPGLLAPRALYGRQVRLTNSGVSVLLVVARE